MKLQFPGILHSSRFSPILKVNNPSHSNLEYSILIVSTSLFNTDIFYNATLLSTKEIRLSMRVDCTIVWECERQFSMSPKTTGVRSRSPSEDSSCGETGIFTAKANTFPLISIFWAEGRRDRKLNTATWNLERIYFFVVFFGFIFKLVEI